MFEYFKNNHFKISYDLTSEKLTHQLNKPAQKLQNPFIESQRAARHIYDLYGDQLVLCMSSGVDSEAMAKVFLQAGVPFKVVSFDYGRGLNQFDFLRAVSFCKENDIRHNLISKDVVDLLQSGQLYKWYEKCECTSLMFSIHLEFLNHLEGVPIMAYEPPHFRIDPMTNKVKLEFMEYPELSFIRYFESVKKPAIPFFFLYAAEQYYSFLQTPVYQELLSGQIFESHYKVKTKAYIQGGFDLKPELQSKKTGFENLIKHLGHLEERTGRTLQDYFETQLELRYGKIRKIKNYISRIEKF